MRALDGESYKDDAASWDDLVQSKHYPHRLTKKREVMPLVKIKGRRNNMWKRDWTERKSFQIFSEDRWSVKQLSNPYSFAWDEKLEREIGKW